MAINIDTQARELWEILWDNALSSNAKGGDHWFMYSLIPSYA